MNPSKLYQYFEEELEYVRSAGRRFAQRHPERAALVSLDNVTGRDPDVERLVQAFAFLAGQVRGELHDELPQITHTLLDLLWPQYLRPVPSTATVEFRPDVHQLPGPTRIAAGDSYVDSAEVESPDTGRGFPCRFRVGYDVDLLPARLIGVEVRRHEQHSELVLSLEVGANADSELPWQRLRLHLAGDPTVALDARYWLLRNARENLIAEIHAPENPPRVVSLPPIETLGFRPNEGLFPTHRISFPGYRLVQEYFLARHKFLYLDLVGLERLEGVEAESKLVLRIPLAEHPPERIRFTPETIRLYCTPVVNLFPSTAIPINYDGKRVEYEILAEHDMKAMAVYQVLGVSGRPEGQTTVRDYPNFLEFRTNPNSNEPCYHISVRPGVDSRPQWRLMLTQPKGIISQQVLSVDLECTNGELAASLLPGKICYRGEGIPDSVVVTSLTQPEPTYPPPLESASPWRFVSHLATNYLSLEDAGTLVGVLKLYDWTPNNTNWRRLEGIRSLRSQSGATIVEGIPLRGRDIEITLDTANFANVGDAYLFSEVLSHFLALYSNVNSYTRLTAKLTTGETFEWPALNGRQRPI